MKGMYLDALIADDIRSAIENYDYKENEKLPSEVELCSMYNVQKMTIRSALQILKDEGCIYSKNKSGYYVQKEKIIRNLRNFQSDTDIIKKKGSKLDISVLQFDKIEANKRISTKMNIDIGTSLYRLDRLRTVDDVKISLERSYLISEYFEGLDKYNLNNRSLYSLFAKEYNVFIDRGEMKLSVVRANKMEASLLTINENDQVIKESGLIFDNHNINIEYVENIMIMDNYIFIR